MKKKLWIGLFLVICGSIIFSDFSVKKEKEVTRNYLKEADLKIVSENYFIDDQKLVQPVLLKSTKESFLGSFQATMGTLNLVCDNGTDYVGTDCLLQTLQESTTTSEYGIVVYGDVTGDGLGTITDIVKMMTYVEKEDGLETVAKKESTDIDGNDKISFEDVEIYGGHFLEEKSITFPGSNQVQTKIELSNSSIVVEKNNSKQLIATTNKGDTAIITWESKNPEVAVVDNMGLVTGISDGKTTIVVAAADGTTKEVAVEVVIPVTGVTLSESAFSIKTGASKTLIATVSPSDATNKNIKWSSSNEKIATVNSSGVVTAVSGGTAVITVTTEDGNMVASCRVTVLVPATAITLSETTVKVNNSTVLTPKLSPSGSYVDSGFVWSSSDESIVTVDQSGKVTGVAAGSATVTVKTADGRLSATATVNVAMVANVNFTGNVIDNCGNNTIVSTTTNSSGKNVTLHSCVEGYAFHSYYSKKLFIQNFAITNNYIYFIMPYNGAWSYPKYIEKNGEEAEFKRISTNHVIRISRADNTYQMTTYDYAGHGQSFDVTDHTITNSSWDVLYLNAFAYMYDTTLNGIYRYGSKYRGVSYTSFRSNYNPNGARRIAGTSLAVSASGWSLKMLKSADYNSNDVFDEEAYFDAVIGVGQNSSYMENPEIAVDEVYKQVAIVGPSYIYIYDLTKFKRGSASVIHSFAKVGSKQGVELSGDFLYQWGDGDTGHKILRKYNINTGKVVQTLDFDISEYYSNKGWTGAEAEGISFYNGNVYVGISGWLCKNSSCSSKAGYNDILMIKGV